jgi:hypothetical protein
VRCARSVLIFGTSSRCRHQSPFPSRDGPRSRRGVLRLQARRTCEVEDRDRPNVGRRRSV